MVTITGTLEMIYTVGADTVSEPLYVDMPSPTEAPLDLAARLAFNDRMPPVDVRDSLDPHLTDRYGFTSLTRVGSPRDGALAEWAAVKEGIPRSIMLWKMTPLRQEGIEWSQTTAGDTDAGDGWRKVELGRGALASGEDAAAIGVDSLASGYRAMAFGPESRAEGNVSTAHGPGAIATGHGAAAQGINAFASGVAATAIGGSSQATGDFALAEGNGAIAEGSAATGIGPNTKATGNYATAAGPEAAASGEDAGAFGAFSLAEGARSGAFGRHATTRADEPDVSEVRGRLLRVVCRDPQRNILPLPTMIGMIDDNGVLHTIGADDINGLTLDGAPVGGGAVDSVNGTTGVVVLDADDIPETANRKWITTAELVKLDSIAVGAEVNVNPDWNASSGDAQILNKPSLYTKTQVDELLATIATHFETFQNSSLVGTALVAATATDTANMVDVFNGPLSTLIPACSSGTWKVLVSFALTAARNVNSGGITAYAGVGGTGAGVIPRGLTVVNTPVSATVMYDAEGATPSTVIRAMFGGQGTAGTTTRSAASMSIMAVRTG